MEISEQEFARMVKAHKSTIYTVCYMFSNDEDEVADLFQEVMIKVWRGLPSFNGQSDVKTWIYRIALNKLRAMWQYFLPEADRKALKAIKKSKTLNDYNEAAAAAIDSIQTD